MSRDLTILDLDKECEIVWDVDVSDLDYVRQSMVMCNSRSRPIRVNQGWLRVGYAVLKPDTDPDYKYPDFLTGIEDFSG